MADGFEAMVDAAQAFFPKLAANNSKEWFEPQKAYYKSEIATPAGLFAEAVGSELGRICETSFRPKVFRIYRDVRFSKDKTPLNAHLHLSWSPSNGQQPGWFWGLSPDYFILGMGIMGLQGAGLAAFRALVDAEGAALEDMMAKATGSVSASLSDYGPEPLKRVPKPYAPDHPQADLLKRKAFALHAPLPPDWRDGGLVNATLATASGLMPVYKLLANNL